MRLRDVTPGMRAYQPFGAAEALFYSRAPEVLLSGPAGTGKSRACLEKLHALAEKYAGMRGLIIRKTRTSCTEGALVTWEDRVLPVGHPSLEGPRREHRHSYRYPNGSEVVVGGLDKPSRTLSTEFDVIYIQEAIELSEHEWEMLTRPLRNGRMPYQQIIADTNPDTPTHWLNQRAQRGGTLMLESRHEDNPILYDRGAGAWTPEGTRYIATLDRLTGARRQRLRFGRWVQAEGVVYEGWDRAIHLVDRFPIPETWPRTWVVDFGYTNPFVWQAWAEDPDGRLYRYREIYMTRRLVSDHAETIKAVTAGEPAPRAIICDHDAEDRATLAKVLGRPTLAAHKAVSPGIQATEKRLRVADDGKPRLLFLRDALVERDSSLAEAGLPGCTEEEFDGYIWDVRAGQRKGEAPVKADDHGMDAMRYRVAYSDLGKRWTEAKAY